MAASGESSTLLSLPPGTGQALIAANTMSGSCVSIANFAEPLILGGTSMRGIGLPMNVY